MTGPCSAATQGQDNGESPAEKAATENVRACNRPVINYPADKGRRGRRGALKTVSGVIDTQSRSRGRNKGPAKRDRLGNAVRGDKCDIASHSYSRISMDQMIFSDSQTSVTKLAPRVTGIPIGDTRPTRAPARFIFSEYDVIYLRARICQRA